MAPTPPITTLINLGPLLGHQPPLNTLLIVTGALTFLTVLYALAKFLLSTFLVPGLSLSRFKSRDRNTATWAVVTGASDGIGREYALQLANQGFSVLLVSRTQAKLEGVQKEIEKQTQAKKSGGGSVAVEILAVDFSRATETDYVHLTNALSGKRVGVLVNNVGLSHEMPVRFEDVDVGELEGIVRVNCLATLRVTGCVLPFMIPHRNGLILTMGSFAGLTPTPLLAVYSGSKAFLQAWNTALGSELAEHNIVCHLVQSYLVTSSMSKIRRANWLVPTERQFVKAALAKIGNQCGSFGFGKYTGSPYWSHALVAAGVSGILGSSNGVVVGVNKKMHVDVRRRALRKKEREGKKVL